MGKYVNSREPFFLHRKKRRSEYLFELFRINNNMYIILANSPLLTSSDKKLSGKQGLFSHNNNTFGFPLTSTSDFRQWSVYSCGLFWRISFFAAAILAHTLSCNHFSMLLTNFYFLRLVIWKIKCLEA